MPRIKVMAIFGTRPDAVKMAPLIKELRKYPESIETLVTVTAQHRQMLDQPLHLFDITPDYDLDIMEREQTLSSLSARILERLDEILVSEKPDLVLVHGDTSTAFIASLVAFYNQIPVGHVEAGLRTPDKYLPFPEEMNRRLVDVIADLYFPPTKSAKANLLAQGVAEENIYLTGNTVIDALLDIASREYEFKDPILKGLGNSQFILVEAHRRENWGKGIENICWALRDINRTYPQIKIVYSVHKNPIVQRTVREILGDLPGVYLTEPVEYQAWVKLMSSSYMILTDSGGIQEEAPSLGKPVLVLREVTERPEGVKAGVLKVIGADRERIFREASRLIEDREAYERMTNKSNPYGDGKASYRLVQGILHHFNLIEKRPSDFNY